jgi:hypothetical protein
MTNVLLTEDDLANKLKNAGKNDAEIDELINKYNQAISQIHPDNEAMNTLLMKTQQSAVLRVRGFNLTGEQYELLNNYFKSPNTESNDLDAFTLVQKTIEEFIKVIQ